MPEGTPKKVKEIAKAVRRENSDMDDESAYKIAWDTYKGNREKSSAACAGYINGFIGMFKEAVIGASRPLDAYETPAMNTSNPWTGPLRDYTESASTGPNYKTEQIRDKDQSADHLSGQARSLAAGVEQREKEAQANIGMGPVTQGMLPQFMPNPAFQPRMPNSQVPDTSMQAPNLAGQAPGGAPAGPSNLYGRPSAGASPQMKPQTNQAPKAPHQKSSAFYQGFADMMAKLAAKRGPKPKAPKTDSDEGKLQAMPMKTEKPVDLPSEKLPIPDLDTDVTSDRYSPILDLYDRLYAV